MTRFRGYYWRVIGFLLAGGGMGLMVDELIEGPFTLTPTNHEFWGLIMLIVGVICIGKFPKGKGD